MSTTSIPWCDYTLNPWIGCSKVSEGCTFCYAAERDKRHLIEKVDHWGKGAPRYRTSEATRNAPYRWNKRPWICDLCGHAFGPDVIAHGCGTDAIQAVEAFHRGRVFLGSLMDIFDEEVPIEWLASALNTVRVCKELDFLLVTKRPEAFQQRVLEAALSGLETFKKDPLATTRDEDELTEFLGGWSKLEYTPPNVWIIASAENQKRLDERIDHLLKIPAAVHGLSCEPLLSSLDLTRFLQWHSTYLSSQAPTPRWVIAGGESGPSARPMDVIWMEQIQRQCLEAQVPYFGKQLGSYCVTENANFHDWPDKLELTRWGTFAAGARINFPADNPKGEKMKDWPEELRVREWPRSATRTHQ